MTFLELQELGGTVSHAQLSATLAESALSLWTIQRWLRRFKEGNTLCEHADRPVGLMIITGNVLRKFFAKYPFGPAKIVSRHFGVSASALNEILVRELGFKKYT
jgi:hypothetical protein